MSINWIVSWPKFERKGKAIGFNYCKSNNVKPICAKQTAKWCRVPSMPSPISVSLTWSRAPRPASLGSGSVVSKALLVTRQTNQWMMMLSKKDDGPLQYFYYLYYDYARSRCDACAGVRCVLGSLRICFDSVYFFLLLNTNFESVPFSELKK